MKFKYFIILYYRMLYNKLVEKTNHILLKYYPIKISFDKINTLSHFQIISNDYKLFLTINMNIDGVILNGEYKNYQIVKVITTKEFDWEKYILLYVSLLNKSFNPSINQTRFIYYLHSYNYIDILNIKKLVIKNEKTGEIIEYKVEYTDTDKKNYYLLFNNIIQKDIIKKDNHFYLESFSVNNNYKNLKIEMDRLIKNRDKYKTIHFHLNNNRGGDIVPAHIIIRCLVGRKERWMKNIKKLLQNNEVSEWDCWKEENVNNPNYDYFTKLNLDNLPNYESKYNGKIYLHMNTQNGSSTWFFITYLIYAFANKIKRYSKKCYGQNIKYGTIESDKLILFGHSDTTSGDGTNVSIKFNNIEIKCPTQQFISSSIKKNDWNRFWRET
jgi:hypothetical protein